MGSIQQPQQSVGSLGSAGLITGLVKISKDLVFFIPLVLFLDLTILSFHALIVAVLRVAFWQRVVTWNR